MLLPELLSALLDAFAATHRGEPFKRFKSRYGIRHFVRSLEVTYGLHGWHPHIHQIILLLAALSDDELEAFREWLGTRWITMLEKRSFTATLEHGLDIRVGQMTVSEYVAKFGYEPRWSASHELARSNSKVARTESSRTPFALLEDFAIHDDEEAGRLFVEFAKAFRGRRKLQTSDGFWSLLPEAEGDISDEEIAAAEDVDPAYEVLQTLSLEQWRLLVKRDLRGELLEYVEMTNGDADSLRAFLTVALA